MQCTVLVFAQLAEALGADRVTVGLPAGSTVAAALDALAATHPPIARLRAVLAVAVNDCYCSTATTLNDGDTLALISPVSGG